MFVTPDKLQTYGYSNEGVLRSDTSLYLYNASLYVMCVTVYVCSKRMTWPTKDKEPIKHIIIDNHK